MRYCLLLALTLSFTFRSEFVAAQDRSRSRVETAEMRTHHFHTKLEAMGRLRGVHKQIVVELENGASLDAPISLVLKRQFSAASRSAYAAMHAEDENANASSRSAMGARTRSTFRDVLRESEKELSDLGVEPVLIDIDAQPKSCSVNYRSVASGDVLFFGKTRARKRLAPKYYEFTCDCAGRKLAKTVDCNDDQSFTLPCEVAKPLKAAPPEDEK
jgi:hypothetical protein